MSREEKCTDVDCPPTAAAIPVQECAQSFGISTSVGQHNYAEREDGREKGGDARINDN